jgi:hypothetical protein
MVEAVKIWEKKSKEKEYLRNHSSELLEKLGVRNDD